MTSSDDSNSSMRSRTGGGSRWYGWKDVIIITATIGIFVLASSSLSSSSSSSSSSSMNNDNNNKMMTAVGISFGIGVVEAFGGWSGISKKKNNVVNKNYSYHKINILALKSLEEDATTTTTATTTTATSSSSTTSSTATTTTTTTVSGSGQDLTIEEEEFLFGKEPNPPFKDRHRKLDRHGNLLEDRTRQGSRGTMDPELDHSVTDPLINKLHSMRQRLRSCPQLWTEMAQIHPDQIALIDDHLCDDPIRFTFAEMDEQVRISASIFQSLGVRKGSHVSILGDNSAHWLLADHGIQRAGGVSAVRGADAPSDELRYIYEHSDSAGIVVLQGPKLLSRLHRDAKAKRLSHLGLRNPMHGPVRHVVLLNRETSSVDELDRLAQELDVTIHVLGTLLKTTGLITSSQLPTLTKEDLSTIVYTSGTTGQPKGVMLTHGNLLHQISHRLSSTKPYEETEPLPGETMVSLLPVWHITERTFELWMLTRSCKVVYSSIRTFRKDMAKYQPEWLVLVPRVLEKIASGVQEKFSSGSVAVRTLSTVFTRTATARAVHAKIVKGLVVQDEAPNGLQRLASRMTLAALSPLNKVGDALVWKKVQEGFGGKLKTIIAGGSALSGSLEQFYEAAGFTLLVGYGLTECSPLLSYRRCDANMVTAGCCGKPCLDTEIRVVDPDRPASPSQERPSLPDGDIGVVLGRGPQVMRGYYKNPDATAKAIDAFGWFDTGDLGRINPATGDLILTGRAKDTIVLSNGENIEPQPIEDALLGASPLLEQVMLTGQDGRRLVAIVVLKPTELAKAGFITDEEARALQQSNEVINDPKCTVEEWESNVSPLRDISTKRLQSDQALQSLLMTSIKTATSNFRPWEQVGAVHVTLEPFAMVNGQLTQSYKVKRPAVLERYGNELPK